MRMKDVVLMATVSTFESMSQPGRNELRQFTELFGQYVPPELVDEMARNPEPWDSHFFFSHVHWDHIQGFPFFGPLFQPNNHFKVYGPTARMSRCATCWPDRWSTTTFRWSSISS